MRRTSRYAVVTATLIVTVLATLAVCAAVLVVCVRAFTETSVDRTEAWNTVAQPVATVLLAAALIAAAISTSRALATQRQVLSAHRQLDLEPVQVRELRSRMLDAAKLLAGNDSTLGVVAVHELLAVLDDWCRLTRQVAHPQRALVEHQRCLDLICGYLRANRQLEPFVAGAEVAPGPEHDERVVREQLCAGMAAHLHRWRHLGPFHLDLTGADLAGMRLRHGHLAGVTAPGAVLTDADLTGTDLSGADLTGASAADARLSGTTLRDANLSRITAPFASFNGTDATGTQFVDADLRGARFLDVVVDRTDFTGANLRAAKLMRIDLSTAAWRSADLSGADTTGAMPVEIHEQTAESPADDGTGPITGGDAVPVRG